MARRLVDTWSAVSKPLIFADAFVLQQIDVVEQEPSARFERHGSRPAPVEQVFRLRQEPGVAKNATTDEDAADTLPEAIHDLVRLDAVAGAEHRNRQSIGNPGDEFPVG